MTGAVGARRTTGPHFFVDPGDVDGSSAVLRGDEAHHLGVVLRARRGDPVSLADGRGTVWQARLRATAQGEARLALEWQADIPPSRPRVVVIHALPKARKLDDVVQRLSEIGVDRLVPVASERSQVHLEGARAGKAVLRWRAVALAASKQSRRARVLEVADIGAWPTSFQGVQEGAVLWEEATGGLRAVAEKWGAADEVVLGVGPEGGLQPDEVAVTGLPGASLGPTILRTETAALVAATVVLAAVGRLG